MIFFVVISILLAGASEAVMDKLQFHFNKSVFSNLKHRFWNPKESSRNKWKNGDKSKGERFLFSSTLLVFTTDAWHLFKWLRNNFLFASTGFIAYMALGSVCFSILIAVSLRILYTSVFEVFFKYVLNIKN